MYIHTLETSRLLDKEKFYKIQEVLKQKDKSKWCCEKNGMTYFGLSDKGILIKLFRINKPGFNSYSIIYRISARRVIDNNDFVGLFDTRDYDDLEDKGNELLKDKCDILPSLKKCNLHRLDFCINAYLESQRQVKAYIKTANRANIPSRLKRKMFYDKTSKRTVPTKNEICVTSENYVEVSLYNKYMEMKTQENYKYPAEEIEKTKNIVRIEIRCMEGKIRALKEKYQIETISQFMRKAGEIGKDLFEYYLKHMFGTGQILTLKDALKNVSMSGYKQKDKDLLNEFLYLSNSSRSVAEAIQLYDEKKIKHISRLLKDIDTSYVTATIDSVKLFKHDYGYIPTPIELFKDYVRQ